jgi:hypothetical protein
MWNSRPYLPALWVDNLTAEDLRTSPNTATAQTARNLRPGGSFLSIISSQCGTDDAPDVEQLAKLGHDSTLSAGGFPRGMSCRSSHVEIRNQTMALIEDGELAQLLSKARTCSRKPSKNGRSLIGRRG